MKRAYKILLTLLTLLIAVMTLFLFVTMDQARAQNSPRASNLGFKHYGVGGLEATRSLVLKANLSDQMFTVAPRTMVDLMFDPERREITLVAHGRKVSFYAPKILRQKFAEGEATYLVRGAETHPPQAHDLIINTRQQPAEPIGAKRFAQLNPCVLPGRYYRVVEKDSRVQTAEVSLLQPGTENVMAHFSTQPTHVTRFIEVEKTLCSSAPVNPLGGETPAEQLDEGWATEVRPESEQPDEVKPEWETTISR